MWRSTGIHTGFGEWVSSFRDPLQSKSVSNRRSISLQYPSEIAEIRRRYELQGLMKKTARLDVFKSAAELRARGDGDVSARDIFPDQTPENGRPFPRTGS